MTHTSLDGQCCQVFIVSDLFVNNIIYWHTEIPNLVRVELFPCTPWRLMVGVEVLLHAFLNSTTRWRWVVNLTLRPLYSREQISSIHWIFGWVSLRKCLCRRFCLLTWNHLRLLLSVDTENKFGDDSRLLEDYAMSTGKCSGPTIQAHCWAWRWRQYFLRNIDAA
jgi:hypothetical protein